MSVAEPLAHDSAHLHVTGRARYVDDVALPANTLHLAFGLSPVAHGEILALDLAAVGARVTAQSGLRRGGACGGGGGPRAEGGRRRPPLPPPPRRSRRISWPN
jgi:hypothetical protein